MDVMESKIERPKKRQKQFYSGKQKEHTLKTQLVIQQETGLIVCIVNGKGR
ncbi:Transposase, IS5 family, partial [Crocosphaera watsonii WH 0003]